MIMQIPNIGLAMIAMWGSLWAPLAASETGKPSLPEPVVKDMDVQEESSTWTGNDVPNFFPVELGLVIEFLPRETNLDPLDQKQLHQLVTINQKGNGLESATVVVWGDRLGKKGKQPGVDNADTAQKRGAAIADFLRSQYGLVNFEVINMEKPIADKRRASKTEVALKKAWGTDHSSVTQPVPQSSRPGAEKDDVNEQVSAILNNGGPQTAVVVIQQKSRALAH